MRITLLGTAVLASMTGHLAVSVASVVGPKLSDRAVIPSSCCRQRIRARMVAQPVRPSSPIGSIPNTFWYVLLMKHWAR